MFITALFIIARTWKQPGCPSADEWIRKLWCIYTTEYYSAIKKNTFESVLVSVLNIFKSFFEYLKISHKHLEFFFLFFFVS